MEIIRLAVLYVNLCIWAVIGLICWIPLLARTTATMAGAILFCTIANSDPQPLRTSFENAVSFYSRGFQTIYRVLGEKSFSSTASAGAKPQFKWEQILLELLWTVLFWASIIIGLGHLLGFF